MKTVDSGQRTADSVHVSASESAAGRYACRVKGCGRAAAVITADGFYCDECWTQNETELEAEADKRDKAEARELARLIRRQERVEAFRRAAAFAAKWLWLPEVVFGVAAVLYVALVASAAWLQWMGW